MISAATLVSIVLGAIIVRPWRVRPRSVRSATAEPGPATMPSPPIVPVGAVWGGAVVAGWVLHPLLGLTVAAVPAMRRLRRSRADRSTSDRAVVRALPEVVDLIVLGVGAGLTTRDALARCEPWLPSPFGPVFREARRRAAAGESFGGALEAISVPLGDPARSLITVLVGAEQTAGSLVPTLLRVGDEARRRRRVEAQERARRLPVTMLLPLVTCVLPAFGLLAVAPLLISSLSGLGLGP
jgi:tight adherence protein C